MQLLPAPAHGGAEEQNVVGEDHCRVEEDHHDREVRHDSAGRCGQEDHHDLEDHCDWVGRYVTGRDWEEEACVKKEGAG